MLLSASLCMSPDVPLLAISSKSEIVHWMCTSLGAADNSKQVFKMVSKCIQKTVVYENCHYATSFPTHGVARFSLRLLKVLPSFPYDAVVAIYIFSLKSLFMNFANF